MRRCTKWWLVVWAALVLPGCAEFPQGETEETGKGYKIRYIDGCQYLEVNYGIGSNRVYSLTHKGDCNNPIHGRPPAERN